MRTAFVSTILGFPWGGADTLWTHAAEAAAERGDALFISVSPAVAAHPRIAALQARGAQLHLRSEAAIPSLAVRAARKLRRVISDTDPLLVALEAFKPDVVLLSLGGTYDFVLHPRWVEWFAKSGAKLRLIANWQKENPTLPAADHAVARQAFQVADFIAFVSTRNLENTRRHLLLPLPQARVVHNPLRWRDTDIAEWPAASGPRIATVSRLDESKGIQLLLHALASLEAGLEWRLNIYGSGPAEARLRATTDALRLGERVAFRGYVSGLRTIWAENHALVSASIEDGVPMTIPEAMLCERPVIATAVGGAEDWLTDETSGFLCPAPSLPLLAATLRRAFAAAGRWRAMGRTAAAAARERYRPDDFRELIA